MRQDELNILLVEDHRAAAELVRRQLSSCRDFRFHLTLADRLTSALALVRRRRFDAVLLDLGLPDALEDEAFEKLYERAPELPVIILSGKDDRERAVRLVRAGAQGYLVKGNFDANSLATTIRYSIERHKLLKAVRESSEEALTTGTRLQALVHHNVDAIIVLDARDSICFANPAAEELFGSSADQLVGTPFIYPLRNDGPGEIEFLGRGGLPVVVEGRSADIDWDGQPARLVTLRNITGRKQLERKIASERGFLQRVVDGVLDPILVTDLDCRVRLRNAPALKLLGDRGEENWPLRCQHGDGQDARRCTTGGECVLDRVRRSGEPERHIVEHRFADGDIRHFEVEYTPLRSDDGSLQGVIEASRDVTDRIRTELKLQENQQALEHLALHDPLTSLPNRNLFMDRLRQGISKARRHKRQLALMFIDLDRFKNVNDTLGHSSGDCYLQEIAARLGGCVRSSDTVARLGGDEFVLLLEEVQDRNSVARMARNFLRVIADSLALEGHELFPSASIGISMFPEDADSAEDLMKCADAAMYQAKDHGRNTFQFYTPELRTRVQDQLILESSLRQALDRDQFCLHFQPQFSLTRRRPVGLEALVRWQHPELGVIPPDRFIPLAEETGLIVPIGEWVLRTACQHHREWLESGMRPMRMAVNLSRRQFLQANLIERVGTILDDTGLPPEYLELEITESTIMTDANQAIATMRALREMGVHLAIDDFGSGYSSLSCLKQFPISKLKIDRSFVRDLTSTGENAAITRAIIALARSLDLEVVAEGIESKEQLRFLKKRGCHHGQGFLFSRPLPVARLTEMVRSWAPRFSFGRPALQPVPLN
ncbi:MAG: hypothetical protein Tsb0017_17110 [Geothermobacteraceae bacterium]